MLSVRNGYEDVLFDYCKRLDKEYDTLPKCWREYFIIKVNNMINL